MYLLGVPKDVTGTLGIDAIPVLIHTIEQSVVPVNIAKAPQPHILSAVKRYLFLILKP